jgi:NAD+ synthase (glutamine-hydrolysing)
MKIALAQINPVIGDIPRNKERILDAYARARDVGANMVVFPELALIGCPAFDLLRRADVIRACTRAAGELAESADTVPLVLGAPYLDQDKLYNAALVLADGQIRHRVYKQHPEANAFLGERQYFSAGQAIAPWEYAGEKIAFSLGQDAFGGRDFSADDEWLPLCPPPGTSLAIVLAATPFFRGISKARRIAQLARISGCPCLMLDLVGGSGEYIFDGGSLAVFPDGESRASARFAEELRIVDTVSKTDSVIQRTADAFTGDASDGGLAELYAACVFGLREYVWKSGFSAAVIGLSGGLDSAMLAVFARDALGAENTVGVSMPSRFSSDGSVNDARALADTLGIRLETLPIEPVAGAFAQQLAALFAGTESGLAEQNLQARIRGTLLMALSNKFAWLLLNTGNKSEAMAGYCTLYGDTNGAFSVIGDIYKTELYALARWINREREIIPDAIIKKAPSAELAPGQLDSDSLPPYDTLDAILELYSAGLDADVIAARGFDAQLVRSVIMLVERSEYKRRQAPPILRLSRAALYFPRRVPLAARTPLFPENLV